MHARPRNEGREFFHQLKGLHLDIGGAVRVRLLETVDHLTSVIEAETLDCNRRPRDVATEFFELLALAPSLATPAWSENSASLATRPWSESWSRSGTVLSVSAFLRLLGPSANR